jgi:hypothetical protein
MFVALRVQTDARLKAKEVRVWDPVCSAAFLPCVLRRVCVCAPVRACCVWVQDLRASTRRQQEVTDENGKLKASVADLTARVQARWHQRGRDVEGGATRIATACRVSAPGCVFVQGNTGAFVTHSGRAASLWPPFSCAQKLDAAAAEHGASLAAAQADVAALGAARDAAAAALALATAERDRLAGLLAASGPAADKQGKELEKVRGERAKAVADADRLRAEVKRLKDSVAAAEAAVVTAQDAATSAAAAQRAGVAQLEEAQVCVPECVSGAGRRAAEGAVGFRATCRMLYVAHAVAACPNAPTLHRSLSHPFVVLTTNW